MATRADYAQGVLQGLGIVPGEANFDLLISVQSFEDSNAANNPLDTTLPEIGATDFNTTGVKNYPTFSEGIQATVATLNEGRYAQFRDVLRGDDTTAMAMALANGGWAGTEPATVLAYTKSLEEMVAMVSLDREKYYPIEVADSEAVADTPVREEDDKPAVAVPPVNETPPEEAKVESAIGAQEATVKEDTAEGKVAKARETFAKLKVHINELEDLLK